MNSNLFETPLLPDAEKGAFGTTIDLDSGKEVQRTIRFEKGSSVLPDGHGNLLIDGIVQAYWTNVFGEIVCDNNEPRVYRAKGRFKFIPKRATPPSVLTGAEACTRCSSPLVLAGDELCPRCKAADRGQRHRFVVEPMNIFEDKPCEEKGCGQLASIMVSDEVTVGPQVSRMRLDPRRTHSRLHGLYWSRSMTVARHHYCERHFKPPRILDDKGEIVEVLEPK